ncbi:uncharacterized protein EI90DRAFT_3198442 [Cantharellus anzutake]|uniref:uncharacterized protein n=1 Tax=Cantharellus anzutake TaxID=1750568 RepID=UPI001905E9FB|nr:uncharacterized protein EI90DRAFT_3198442 [Cantharellus anzutake]KAF8331422.1 hypothetical protein EI90DRAFT_3198442 [Cantharellus anzutake]
MGRTRKNKKRRTATARYSRRRSEHYHRNHAVWPIISTAADSELRKILKNTEIRMGDMAKKVIDHQLKHWEEAKARMCKENISLGIPCNVALDELSLKGILGEHPSADIETIKVAFGKTGYNGGEQLWNWIRLPYTIRCLGLAGRDLGPSERGKKRAKTTLEEYFVADVDEWVLKNERYIRILSRRHNLKSIPADAPHALSSWKYGLVNVEDIQSVIPDSTVVNDQKCRALEVKRRPVASFPGYTVLHAKRHQNIFLQTSKEGFKMRWDEMTDGILTGLNWSNVFVAGGMVLSTLLTPELPSKLSSSPGAKKPGDFKDSDIDLYIYGLAPQQANAKIEHIETVYKKNLPPNAPFLVVRNSQTITFYSEYPRRRVQIVLKLIGSPREVLLNFDLDICAVGYDGTDVWLLPRCVRALETGLIVFTMDLIDGHYLGDRKATRDQRQVPNVFKYANKGYGIRILPSYLDFLAIHNDAEALADISRGENLIENFSIEPAAKAARDWTSTVIKRYLFVGHENKPFHLDVPHLNIDLTKPIQSPDGKPVFSHAMLESYGQITSEPLWRSCLTGFSLFMRHVALWEAEVAGKIHIFEGLFASDTYGEGSQTIISYDDTPAYKWDASFTIPEFKKAIEKFNSRESDFSFRTWPKCQSFDRLPKDAVARVTYADSVLEVMGPSNDIGIPLVMTTSAVGWVNETIETALQECGMKFGSEHPLVVFGSSEDSDWEDSRDETIVLWRLDKITNWQMLDRRIDEVREVLWAFHRANERMTVEHKYRLRYFKTNISRRAIRDSIEDEAAAFIRWACRKPFEQDTKIHAHYLLAGYKVGEDEDLEK